MVYSLEFNSVSGSEAQKRAQQDFDDLQNEFAGRDVGRIARFLNGENDHPNSDKQRRRKEDAQLSRFMALMQSAEYARLYEDTGRQLRETRQFLDDAKEQLAAMRAKFDSEQHEILSRAARLPDGTLVFRGDDDRAYERDGALSDDPSAQNIIWREDHAKLSEIQRGDDRMQKVDAVERELNSVDQEVGIMQERYEDTDEPLSLDEMNGMAERSKQLHDELSEGLKSLTKSTEQRVTIEAGISVPAQLKGLENF